MLRGCQAPDKAERKLDTKAQTKQHKNITAVQLEKKTREKIAGWHFLYKILFVSDLLFIISGRGNNLSTVIFSLVFFSNCTAVMFLCCFVCAFVSSFRSALSGAWQPLSTAS